MGKGTLKGAGPQTEIAILARRKERRRRHGAQTRRPKGGRRGGKGERGGGDPPFFRRPLGRGWTLGGGGQTGITICGAKREAISAVHAV